MSEYLSGYRFGVAYARNYGTKALLRFARDRAKGSATTAARCYSAGVVDAALAVVQGEVRA